METYPVTKLCKIMEVSRSGFYRYLSKSKEKSIDKDFKLVVKTKEIFSKSRGSYGARRIAKALSSDEQIISRYKAGMQQSSRSWIGYLS